MSDFTKRNKGGSGPESGDFATSFAKLAELAAQDLAASAKANEEKASVIIVGKKKASEHTAPWKDALHSVPLGALATIAATLCLLTLGYLAYPNIKALSEMQHRPDLSSEETLAAEEDKPNQKGYAALDAIADIASARPLSQKSFSDIETNVTLDAVKEAFLGTATQLAQGLHGQGLSWQVDTEYEWQVKDSSQEADIALSLGSGSDEAPMCQ